MRFEPPYGAAWTSNHNTRRGFLLSAFIICSAFLFPISTPIVLGDDN